MKFLFDTDHFTVFQRRTGVAYTNLTGRMRCHQPSDFGIASVTIHEQMIGLHARINRAKRLAEVVRGYQMLFEVYKSYQQFEVVSFDEAAAQVFEAIQPQKQQLGVMDARIAAIALSRGLTLLTRNQRDFVKVPGLKMEDWTMAKGRSETIAL